jgi:hypothetical protein
VRRFELRVAIAALSASATAISVSRAILGDATDFHVPPLIPPGATIRPLFFVLGALAGLAAVVYNRMLLRTMATFDRLDRWPVEVRAGLIGAAVGMLAWFAPDLVGGGDPITQRTLAGAGCDLERALSRIVGGNAFVPELPETVSRLQRSLADPDFKAATKRGAVMSALDANEFALAEIARVLPTAG